MAIGQVDGLTHSACNNDAQNLYSRTIVTVLLLYDLSVELPLFFQVCVNAPGFTNKVVVCPCYKRC
jgi:hypothetical protein